ncbi:MAG: prepilin-type N-terminal cleavage/methylation domain-containing protein [Lentisphaerae bacterium]|nr:prepilin-type N-terminal cleavage/methylation domain-containing protein [Lentisphaerota bacterium]
MNGWMAGGVGAGARSAPCPFMRSSGHPCIPRAAAPPPRRAAFTLIELLVVIAIISILMLLIAPVVKRGLDGARRSACASNLRQVQGAFTMYLAEHDGRFFPFREDVPGGVLWYWGFEPGGGGAEGARPLDKSRARLAPYFAQTGGIEICPALPYRAAYFKRKFGIPSYGYGINGYMLSGLPGMTRMGVHSIEGLTHPGRTITWGDCIQINTWQAPASGSNPMLEEWYVLDNMPPPHFHFRHGRRANLAMADGSVNGFDPHSLDPRCDGRAGYLEPPRQETWLLTRK